MMLLIDLTILNAIHHIGLSIKLKKYNPGLVFGGIIGLIVNIVVIGNIIYNNIIPLWSVLLFLLLIVPFLIETAISSSKNKIPKMLEWIFKFSTLLEKAMIE